ncbi:MAG: adenosylcobinamide-phosphate synthase CbiB [Pseudomonadota bacterium]
MPFFLLAAWGLEVMFGWPAWLYARIRHPVVWVGAMIEQLDRLLNRPQWSHAIRYIAGMVSTLIMVALVSGVVWAVTTLLTEHWWAVLFELALAASLIASRSLFEHVSAVAQSLCDADISNARRAVARIVGRDATQLDEAGIARASLESLAENMSDGVVAPLFWGACLGLPGLAAYKAINTLDSMIGHRSDRYAAFGGFAARLDDVANLIPARLTALLIAAASLRASSFRIALRDASAHRSPNAGWPESAMAGALNVRLSGPRAYGGQTQVYSWLNATRSDPDQASIRNGLDLYCRALILGAILLLVIGVLVML